MRKLFFAVGMLTLLATGPVYGADDDDNPPDDRSFREKIIQGVQSNGDAFARCMRNCESAQASCSRSSRDNTCFDRYSQCTENCTKLLSR